METGEGTDQLERLKAAASIDEVSKLMPKKQAKKTLKKEKSNCSLGMGKDCVKVEGTHYAKDDKMRDENQDKDERTTTQPENRDTHGSMMTNKNAEG